MKEKKKNLMLDSSMVTKLNFYRVMYFTLKQGKQVLVVVQEDLSTDKVLDNYLDCMEKYLLDGSLQIKQEDHLTEDDLEKTIFEFTLH